MSNEVKIRMARYLDLPPEDFDLSYSDYYKVALSRSVFIYDCFCVQFASEADKSKAEASHETAHISDQLTADPAYHIEIRYSWRNVDTRGMPCQPFFAMSVNDGPHIDVESVVKRWENRDNITKPAYRKI